MKKIIYLFTILLASQWASAETVKVAFGMSKAPFVIDETKTGIEVSLVEEAFKRAGYTIEKNFVSNKRMIPELQEKKVDVAVSIQKDRKEFFYSDAFISYDNYAVAKKKRHFKIDTMANLKGKTLVSWQNAPLDLNNKEFDSMLAAGAFQLSQQPKQEQQVKLFLMDRFELIIIDKTILRYLANKMKNELNLKDDDIEFDYFKLFPGLTSFYNGFRDEALKDKFNKALSEMRADGTYNNIVESYIKGAN